MHQNIIEAQDYQGNTALFSCVRYNQESSLRVLLQFNCNLFHRNRKGDTILHYAARYNATDCLATLSGFVGEQLFAAQNKDGILAIEIAHQL